MRDFKHCASFNVDPAHHRFERSSRAYFAVSNTANPGMPVFSLEFHKPAFLPKVCSTRDWVLLPQQPSCIRTSRRWSIEVTSPPHRLCARYSSTTISRPLFLPPSLSYIRRGTWHGKNDAEIQRLRGRVKNTPL